MCVIGWCLELCSSPLSRVAAALHNGSARAVWAFGVELAVLLQSARHFTGENRARRRVVAAERQHAQQIMLQLGFVAIAGLTCADLRKVGSILYGKEVARKDMVGGDTRTRSEEHTSEIKSLMRISYAVFCLKKKKNQDKKTT